MNTPAPNDGNDGDEAMREALQRDAARVAEPPFDAALHHATMRRIRALTEPNAKASCFQWWPTFATATAVLALAALAALAALWRPHASPKNEAAVKLAPQLAAPRASLLAYQAAASQSDDALFALLDRDARDLLPASSPIFNTTLR